ncbi:MAG: ABC transporter substrate-binding protein [Betaproteobacteria bacterium]|nr:ABC transporter substrate-binding protein [Betaproteobacteria bacterium]
MKTIRIAALACLLAAHATLPARAQSEPIRIGQSISLTGAAADHGNAVLAGVKAALAKANAEGGVRGRRIELRVLDDAGDAAKSGANAKALARDAGIVALFGGVEGGPCVAQMKEAVEAGVPLVACMAGSPELRDPGHRLVFPVRAGHYDEFARLIEQAIRYGMGRIAFVHSDSDTGRRHLANVRKLLAAQGRELTLALAMPSKPDMKALAKQLVDGRIEAVFNHGSFATYSQLLRETRALGATTQFMAVNSGAQQMVRLLGPDAKGLIFTQVVPFPWGMERAIVREYQVALRKLDPQAAYSFSSLEGYISARVLVEALRRAKSPTREGLVQSLEGMETLELGGFALSYGRDSRAGSAFVDTVIATSKGDFRH